jgi:2-amino-4-hydroxy-6-hydroxymethyldihydropteridine diphosphokinase
LRYREAIAVDKWTKAYLGLGSNLGDRRKNLDSALRMLDEDGHIRVLSVSKYYETAPVGGPPQGKFINAAAKIETAYSPRELLATVLAIEKGLGRKRTVKNVPRVIDIDILLFGDLKIEEDGLTIPHPRMFQREFVMMPLHDINPTVTDGSGDNG